MVKKYIEFYLGIFDWGFALVVWYLGPRSEHISLSSAI
jgi:hypothetical protein